MKQFAFAAILAAFLVVGCGAKPEETSSSSSPAATASAKEPTATAQVVDYTNPEGKLFCPVMNKVIASKDAAHGYQDYEGKRYYFCCDMCPPKFKENPALYAKK